MAAKALIQNQYNDWFSKYVSHQLKSGKDSTNIKISPNLSDMKPLHADWIVNLRNHMQGECETVVKGFKKLVSLKPSMIQKLFTKELKTRLDQNTFMFEEKKMENKAEVLV